MRSPENIRTLCKAAGRATYPEGVHSPEGFETWLANATPERFGAWFDQNYPKSLLIARRRKKIPSAAFEEGNANAFDNDCLRTTR